MSTYKVPITTIREILSHENADKLEIAKCYDWSVVVQKGKFLPGQLVIYVPVDSILPQDLENKIFPPESKIKLNKHRVKSIKIRGQISQGMILSPEEVQDYILVGYQDLETDISSDLKITKYEPPVKSLPSHMQIKKAKKKGNPNFKKYTDIENFKYYDRTFQDSEMVYISEKLHGTSFRCGWFKTEANTILKKIKKFFGMLPEWEFCYGSRTVEISAKIMWNGGYYGEDVYSQMVEKYKLKDVIPQGHAIYGEIVGDGIQKGYTYGCKPGERKLFVYDVMDTNEMRWLDYPQFNRLVNNMELNAVPKLYVGPFTKDKAEELRIGASTVGEQLIREGIVIKPIPERKTGSLSRCVLKFINDAYYLKQTEIEGTEFH